VIFRQLFDSVSGTYSYLIASRRGAEALIIDPVLEKVDRYLQLMNELDLRLVKAVDTHLHADHVTGLGALRAKHPRALAEPRQVARFLCGLTSPALTREKLSRHPWFGVLAERRFADVLAFVGAPAMAWEAGA